MCGSQEECEKYMLIYVFFGFKFLIQFMYFMQSEVDNLCSVMQIGLDCVRIVNGLYNLKLIRLLFLLQKLIVVMVQLFK